MIRAAVRPPSASSRRTTISSSGSRRASSSGRSAVSSVRSDWLRPSKGFLPRALDRVSFAVPKGQKVALVGLSGGGKTTITSLLLRFYEPTQGRITLDGEDIRRFQQKEWRKKIGLVLQDIHLFPGTLEDNLRVLRDEIPREAMDRALRVVQAEAMVKRLPEGARNVFVLTGLYGHSHEEAATMLGIAVGTSKAQLHRARRLLAEQLQL
mgnify:CR=1 FL=1